MNSWRSSQRGTAAQRATALRSSSAAVRIGPSRKRVRCKSIDVAERTEGSGAGADGRVPSRPCVICTRGWPEFDLEARLQFAEQEARTRCGSRRGSMREAIHALELNEVGALLDATLQQHNQQVPSRRRGRSTLAWQSACTMSPRSRASVTCGREIDRVYNLLKNNVLVEKHEQLQQLKRASTTPSSRICARKSSSRSSEGKRQLDLLNKELINHRFGSDREQIPFRSRLGAGVSRVRALLRGSGAQSRQSARRRRLFEAGSVGEVRAGARYTDEAAAGCR